MVLQNHFRVGNIYSCWNRSVQLPEDITDGGAWFLEVVEVSQSGSVKPDGSCGLWFGRTIENGMAP